MVIKLWVLVRTRSVREASLPNGLHLSIEYGIHSTTSLYIGYLPIPGFQLRGRHPIDKNNT